MLINKDTVSGVEMMTDEERKNPELVKNRKEYKSTPISVYYGSEKPELINTCLTCKKHDNCEYETEIEYKGQLLRYGADNHSLTQGMTEKEIEKLRHNVFIVINCTFKE